MKILLIAFLFCFGIGGCLAHQTEKIVSFNKPDCVQTSYHNYQGGKSYYYVTLKNEKKEELKILVKESEVPKIINLVDKDSKIKFYIDKYGDLIKIEVI